MKANSRLIYIFVVLVLCIAETGRYGMQAQQLPLGRGEERASAGPVTDKGFMHAMMNSMAKMDKDMMASPMTGDPDIDFAAMMIPHHQGATDMARVYLPYGKDAILRRIAQEIVDTQSPQIDLMRERLAVLLAGRPGNTSSAVKEPHPAADKRFGRAMMDSMAKMDKDMMAPPMKGDPDIEFAAMMIPHHKGASEMARIFLLYGKDPVLRRVAQDIIVTQPIEINVMQGRLTALQASGRSKTP